MYLVLHDVGLEQVDLLLKLAETLLQIPTKREDKFHTKHVYKLTSRKYNQGLKSGTFAFLCILSTRRSQWEQ